MVAKHNRKVLGYIVQKNLQGWLGRDVLLGTQDLIFQHALIDKREVLRVSSADKLQDHLHQLFAC